MHYRFWTSGELRAEGWSASAVATAVRDGRLTTVRRGHYAASQAPDDLVRAMRIGGPATATTATRVLGVWTPPDPVLHVAVPLNTPRLRDPDDPAIPLGDRSDVLIHWSPSLARSTAMTGMAPLRLVFQHLIRTTEPAFAVAALDSALHLRLLRPSDLAVIAADVPRPLRVLLDAVDGRCESGIESIARYLLQNLGLRVEPQVEIAGVGRVDLLVEGRLIVELDGRRFHPDFERDRRRDADAARRRYRTLRFSYAQVLYNWATVQAAILAAL